MTAHADQSRSLLWLWALLVIVVAATCIANFYESPVDRRAWLTLSKVALTTADTDLHKSGGFTNRYQKITVTPYTNRFTVGGIDYQCELAAQCKRLNGRGFLAITTNRIFVWIDTKQSPTPLVKTNTRPRGF